VAHCCGGDDIGCGGYESLINVCSYEVVVVPNYRCDQQLWRWKFYFDCKFQLGCTPQYRLASLAASEVHSAFCYIKVRTDCELYFLLNQRGFYFVFCACSCVDLALVGVLNDGCARPGGCYHLCATDRGGVRVGGIIINIACITIDVGLKPSM
jgi:hypothetical protein